MTLRADFTQSGILCATQPARSSRLRAAGLVVEVRCPFVGTVLTTTTQDLANQVLQRQRDLHPAQGQRRRRPGFGGGCRKIARTISDNMLSIDEPDHARLRAIVDEAFLPAGRAGNGASHSGDRGRASRRAVCGMRPPISSTAMREGCRFR